LTDFCQACTTDQAADRLAPKAPEHEHSTPTVIGDPVAADPLWLAPGETLAAALAAAVPGALLLPLLPDEQALTDVPRATITAAAIRMFRR
jgi:hypothetical protein